MPSRKKSPKGTAPLKTGKSFSPADLIAEKGGLFIPFENMNEEDVARLMEHLATYDVKPVACGEIIEVVPHVPLKSGDDS